jgi:hypothetical protein
MSKAMRPEKAGFSSAGSAKDGIRLVQSGGPSHTAILVHRVGPYHFARLREAGKRLKVTAIEWSGVDNTYDWAQVTGADCFTRVTLFDSADSATRPAGEIIERMRSALNSSRIVVRWRL